MHARQRISGSARLARERLECVMGDRDNDGAVGAARRMDTNGRMDTNANGYERGETGERQNGQQAGEGAERANGRNGQKGGRTGERGRKIARNPGSPFPPPAGAPFHATYPV